MEHMFPEFRAAVKAGRQVIVAGESFGCGSSREEAPRALIGVFLFFLFSIFGTSIQRLIRDRPWSPMRNRQILRFHIRS